MKKYAKKYLIPHEENMYHPHLFRNTSVLSILFICAFSLGASYGNNFFLQKTVLGANISTNVLVDLANINRSNNNAPLLARNTELDSAAKAKAGDMANKGYFAHFAPDGTTPWYFIRQAGYDFVYAGENLAINYTEANDIDTAWMNSPTHRENLLNKNFKEVGIATQNGVYNGENTVYVVQMFGAEREKAVAVKPVTTSAEKNTLASNTKQAVKKLAIATTVTPNKVEPVYSVKEEKNIQVIAESSDFISVKNTDVSTSSQIVLHEISTSSALTIVDTTGVVAGANTYSKWYERMLFNGSLYVQVVLSGLVLLITIGMLFRIFIEYRKQEFRQVVLSGIFLVIVIAVAVTNYKFIFFF